MADLTEISGGITNKIYKMKKNDKYCILRVYSDSDDQNPMFDRSDETSKSIRLGMIGIGPQIYKVCEKYRIEEYYNGDNLLNYDPYVDETLYLEIAKKLRIMHIKTKSMINDEPLDVLKLTNHFKRMIESNNRNKQIFQYYPDFYDRYKKCTEIINDLPLKPDDVSGCHNDLHHGNIMNVNNCIKIIDFEYFGCNVVWFDVANYFNELCGFGCDWISVAKYNWDRYPDLKMRTRFYEAYLSDLTDQLINSNELERIEKCVRILSCVVNLMWALWGLVKHIENKNNEFDYLGYFKIRMDRFNELIDPNLIH